MSQTERLIEQHVREYEARLKHIDELMEQARVKGATPESDQELAEIHQQRDELAGQLGSLKANPEQREVEDVLRYGPMGLWDILAQRLEHVIERLEK